MALDHVSIGVSDIARALAFYDAALQPLGMKPVMPVDIPGIGRVAMGYGETPSAPCFWVQYPIDQRPATLGNGVHVALPAPNRAAVDACHAVGLTNGGTDDGPPGLRPDYHANYYAAFLRDPDGAKIEAVCHAPGGGRGALIGGPAAVDHQFGAGHEGAGVR